MKNIELVNCSYRLRATGQITSWTDNRVSTMSTLINKKVSEINNFTRCRIYLDLQASKASRTSKVETANRIYNSRELIRQFRKSANLR